MDRLQESLDYIKKHITLDKIDGIEETDTALILGSGLSYLAEEMENRQFVKTSDIPNYPKSTVLGHMGEIVVGTIENKRIIIMSGRVHYYEGYTMEDVVYPIRVLHALGVKNLILTNAAGGINKGFVPGDLMLITDYINNILINPLEGEGREKIEEVDRLGFSEIINKKIKKASKTLGVELKEGTYVAMTGPSFETPAEIRFLEEIGGDSVGMSTVPETIMALSLDMEVSGVSCITNYAAGISDAKLTHHDVSETANRIKGTFIKLLKEIVREL